MRIQRQKVLHGLEMQLPNVKSLVSVRAKLSVQSNDLDWENATEIKQRLGALSYKLQLRYFVFAAVPEAAQACCLVICSKVPRSFTGGIGPGGTVHATFPHSLTWVDVIVKVALIYSERS